MDSATKEFISRVFDKPNSNWWHNLCSETPKKKYGEAARFLETTLETELSDIPGYRRDDRSLYFFSRSSRSSIDGRYGPLGVEKKYNPLNLKEHLIDGAIHRGFVWTVGKPQTIHHRPESVALYVVQKGSSPMDKLTTDLYVPILLEIAKIGVYVIFVDEESGEYWHAKPSDVMNDLPSWLSSSTCPARWDLELGSLSEKNIFGLSLLGEEVILESNPSL